MPERVGIVAARRTAIGSFGGVFTDVSAIDLAVETVRTVLADGKVPADAVDEVIVGNILSSGLGQNIARQISIGAGCPMEVPAYAVNKLCGSGMKAIALGTGAILLGEAQIVVAGGTENMSRTPFALPTARFGARMGNSEIVDLLIHDALTDAFGQYHMGVTAENLADRHEITREEMDRFAAESQQKTADAIASGRFVDEIVPIQVPRKKGTFDTVDRDEHPRENVTVEGLGRLRPAFRPNGRVTAGNSSGINDGAAFVVLASESEIERRGLTPMAWIVSYASAAVDPAYMGYGPVPATQKALERAGRKLSQIELVELNEAFAAQSLAVLQGFDNELGGIDRALVNVNGGAIALGHPVGASGARILVTLLHEMRRRSVSCGLATLCIGGGQGTAIVVDRAV